MLMLQAGDNGYTTVWCKALPKKQSNGLKFQMAKRTKLACFVHKRILNRKERKEKHVINLKSRQPLNLHTEDDFFLLSVKML
jgi:hypothetical protein